MESPKYKIFSFRAYDEPELCQKYSDGHAKVLADYGIENITSNNNEWTKSPNIYCLGLMIEGEKKLLGGIRVQLADGINQLPVEKAIGYMDSNIYNVVDFYAQNGGIGELSGLWIDNSLRGNGFGVYMVRAAIAASTQLKNKTMIGICGDVTLEMFNNVGFVVDKGLGNAGTFLYPNEELIAHAVGILNALSLESASENDRAIMQGLRESPIHSRVEIEVGKNIFIDYNLKFPTVVPVNYIKKTIENNS